MILFSLALLLVGVFLSAFFSGSETGFYRASRVRMVMDGLDGDRIAKGMLKLFNNPTLFVATTLVGNNVANYVTSLAIVLLARSFSSDSSLAEMVAPVAFSPLLFVCCELLPKQLFYMAPNRLLRLAAPFFLFCTILFAPIAAVLWSLARLLESMLGQSPEKVRLLLAKKELEKVLDEGEQAGILHPTQRLLGQNFFVVAAKSVRSVCTPVQRAPAIALGSNRKDVLRLARNQKLADIAIYKDNKTNIIGYVRTVELLLDHARETIDDSSELMTIRASELFGEALLQMQAKHETIARVIADSGQTVGLLSIDQLTDPLLKGSLGSLRR